MAEVDGEVDAKVEGEHDDSPCRSKTVAKPARTCVKKEEGRNLGGGRRGIYLFESARTRMIESVGLVLDLLRTKSM